MSIRTILDAIKAKLSFDGYTAYEDADFKELPSSANSAKRAHEVQDFLKDKGWKFRLDAFKDDDRGISKPYDNINFYVIIDGDVYMKIAVSNQSRSDYNEYMYIEIFKLTKNGRYVGILSKDLYGTESTKNFKKIILDALPEASKIKTEGGEIEEKLFSFIEENAERISKEFGFKPTAAAKRGADNSNPSDAADLEQKNKKVTLPNTEKIPDGTYTVDGTSLPGPDVKGKEFMYSTEIWVDEFKVIVKGNSIEIEMTSYTVEAD